MAASSFSEFGEMQLSVLQEVCNMGAGGAATNLSRMISSPTDISTPQVRTSPKALAAKVAGMVTANSEIYLVKLGGDVQGALIMSFPYTFIEKYHSVFFPGTEVKSREDLNEMSFSALCNLAGTSAESYAGALSCMSGMNVLVEEPIHIQSVSDEILSLYDPVPDLCFINNTIEILDCKKTYSIFFYPELNTIQAFMTMLGLPC